MKRWMLSLLVVAALSTTMFGQSEETLFGNSGLRLSGAWGGSSTGLTFFDEDYAVTTGGFGGLEFGKNVFVGWGGYSTTNAFDIDDFQNNRLKLRYSGLMLGYMPFAYSAVHPKVMLLTGGGRLSTPGEESDRIFVVQPSVGVELNVLRWFRLGLEGGYRVVLDNDLSGISDQDISAPFAQMTFKFGFSWGKSNMRVQFDED
ncbi:MAG: hypothetical protein KDC24_13100 [Saprospiraceae bacterium]|nr:hypothetical protein [Saprospiraceae bacterium]